MKSALARQIFAQASTHDDDELRLRYEVYFSCFVDLATDIHKNTYVILRTLTNFKLYSISYLNWLEMSFFETYFQSLEFDFIFNVCLTRLQIPRFKN